MQNFREAVQSRLDETGMSMSYLAKEAKVGRAYLYRVLAGKQVPTIEVADKVAAVLGLAVRTIPAAAEKNSE